MELRNILRRRTHGVGIIRQIRGTQQRCNGSWRVAIGKGACRGRAKRRIGEVAGRETAGSGNSRLVQLTFLRTDLIRRESCLLSHTRLVQCLHRTTRCTSLRDRPLHFLQRYGSNGFIRPARSRLYMEGAVSFPAVPSHSLKLQIPKTHGLQEEAMWARFRAVVVKTAFSRHRTY